MKFKVGDRVRVILGPYIPWGCTGGGVGLVGIVLSIRRETFPSVTGCCESCTLDVSSPQCGSESPVWYSDALELVPPDKEQTVRWSECHWSPRALAQDQSQRERERESV